ncbi:MAG: amidohydrolase family protein [Burkholderiales bacterium]
MKIIDFRLRPPLRGFLDMVMYTNPQRRNVYTRQLGLEPAVSAEQKSMELLLDEMKAVNVVAGVVTARVSDYFGSVTNDDVKAMCKDYPGKLYGMAAVDPTNRKRAIQQIDTALAEGFKGVTIEPGAYPVPLYADDRRLYPIYAHLEDRNVPTVIMTGGNAGPDLSYSDPVTLDRVAADFPNLRIVVSHGNWPWVSEILHVAYRRGNVSLSPDMYFHNMPGMDDYLKAANSWMSERFFFATAYPLAPLKEYTEWFVRLPLKPENMERIAYRNAAELLGIAP